MYKLTTFNIEKNEQMKVLQISYEILGNLFSLLELYAYRISGKSEKNLIFRFYNNDFNKPKNLIDLRNQIIAQIELFKFSYQMYIEKYGKYTFPNNLPKEKLIEFLMTWKSIIPDLQQCIFYDAIIGIINGNFDISLVNNK